MFRRRTDPHPAAWRVRRAVTLTGLVLAGVLLVLIAADRIFPPDLSRYHDTSPVVTDREGRVLRAFLASDGIWRLPATPGDVHPRFLALLQAYEDKRFAHHWGVDPVAVARAAGQWAVHGRPVSGASTLTMQAARLLEPGPRGLLAKARQMLRALQLEARFTKDEILGIYLTLAPYGGNLEGVRAASLAYFDKEPDALTPGQAALLVALPQSPEALRPDRRPGAARKGRAKVLTRLYEAGHLAASAYGEALNEPVPERRAAFPMHAPRLADRLARAGGPGSVTATSIDRDLQQAVETFLARHMRGERDGASAAVIVADNTTRTILAYLGGADLWGPGGFLDLAQARRSPGSALKPFLYGLALDDRLIHPETLIEDRPMAFGAYAPQNFDRGFQGEVSIREALQYSLNVPAVAVLDRVGPGRFYASLRRAGADVTLPAKVAAPSLPIALGGLGITLHDLTALYVGLANGGVAAPLTLDPEAVHAMKGRRLFGPAAAWYLTDMLRGAPLPDGWGQARNIVRDRSIAFKTGTSYGFRDAWAVGSSARYTVGVWTGRADATPRPGRYGRNDAAPVMLHVFSLLPGESQAPAPVPENVLPARTRADLPAGLRVFRHGLAPVGAALGQPAPRIAFPPHGSQVPQPDEALILKAEDGTPPLRWIVNGAVIEPAAETPRRAAWTPDGLGFIDISVVDAEGRSAQASVRLIE